MGPKCLLAEIGLLKMKITLSEIKRKKKELDGD